MNKVCMTHIKDAYEKERDGDVRQGISPELLMTFINSWTSLFSTCTNVYISWDTSTRRYDSKKKKWEGEKRIFTRTAHIPFTHSTVKKVVWRKKWHVGLWMSKSDLPSHIPKSEGNLWHSILDINFSSFFFCNAFTTQLVHGYMRRISLVLQMSEWGVASELVFRCEY